MKNRRPLSKNGTIHILIGARSLIALVKKTYNLRRRHVAQEIQQAEGKPRTLSIASLGCPKNLVDAESMAGRLQSAGFQLLKDAEDVDLLLLNTCGFLRSAREEAEKYIREALVAKRSGSIKRLIVSGCAVASDGEELAKRYPDVDAWISPYDEGFIGEIAKGLFAEDGGDNSAQEAQSSALKILAPEEAAAARFFYHPTRSLVLDDTKRLSLTSPHVAYLKIADGCDRFCTYCTIPNIRGRYVSKPLSTILDEASRLADAGVRELVLIAQETTFWGSDLYGKPDLARLLEALKSRNQFDWIRVLYSYPLFWDQYLVSLFKMEEPGTTSILPYVDMPLQHCNDALLKKMNRRADKAQTEELLSRLREEIPDLVMRTSFIVGFPGETDEAFQELLAFAEKYRFERAGVFEFSPEPGAPASKYPDQVDADVKRLRYERLYAKQERISHQYARKLVGQTMDVMLDAYALADNGEPMSHVCLGRTRADAPDVDPIVYVTGRNLQPGDIIPCEIVEVSSLDLVAVPVDPDKIYVPKDERRKAHERREMREEGGSKKKRAKKRQGRADN